MKKTLLLALIKSLKSVVASCRLPPFKTEWGDYYEDTNYSRDAMSAKETLVKDLVDKFVGPHEPIHDLGANTGRFSRLVSNSQRDIVSYDIDELAVERNYLYNKQHKVKNVLPLILDLTNPAPALGWALEERMSMPERTSNQVVMALALIHHLAISNNVPLDRLAKFFCGLATKLIIEFVPKQDSQVQRLLTTRKDIFPDYVQSKFETAFSECFDIAERNLVSGTERTIYLMTRRV
jgi:ribosomal protein L11 methylase PrmA